VALLDVRGLTTVFDTASGRAVAVNGIDLTIEAGETVAMVGESGCGKSAFAFSLLRLIKPPGRVIAGEVRLEGRDLLSIDEAELRAVRGRDASIIFQEPSTSLNPVMRVGDQIAEAMVIHGKADRVAANRRVVDLLRQVGVPAPELRVVDYPHELSGGMRQRVMIAMALACEPKLLIADEPTTALDVTIQAQVLDLLQDLKRAYRMAVLLITHDLGVVSQWSDRMAVIYAGRKVEEGPTRAVLDDPRHPYTKALLGSRPDIADVGGRLREIPGTVPPITAIPQGCAFAERCPYVEPHCRAELPFLAPMTADHTAACFVAQRKVLAS
jgi:oligopeptide/dipeptide ABC transporter ATP-binding protein